MPPPFHERDLQLLSQKGLEKKRKIWENVLTFNSCFAMLIVSGFYSEVSGRTEYMSKKLIFIQWAFKLQLIKPYLSKTKNVFRAA